MTDVAFTVLALLCWGCGCYALWITQRSACAFNWAVALLCAAQVGS